jgi:choline dehydrogenase
VYDYIVVGAGSAGCVVAARLSERAHNRVLLLEAGPPDRKQEIRIPAAFGKLFHSEVDWDYRTEPDAATGNRALYWPRGKMLGGSSSMNAMMYVRGHRNDYDQWRQLGNKGWGFDDVLPYFKRSENFSGESGDPAFHGQVGPLHVSSLRTPNPLTTAFIAAGEQLGLARNDDVNGPTQDGIGLTHVTQRRGARCSSADAFLRPAMRRSNLTVQTDCLVQRISFEGKRAAGVVYTRRDQTIEAKAAREIILCGGAIGSPQLLMLSGVGPASALRELGIEVVSDRAGVGQNLQDHLAVAVTCSCRQPITLASAESLSNLARYLLLRRGPLTSNVAEALAFIRTREHLAAPDIELLLAPSYFMEHGAKNPRGHGFTVGVVLLRPQSSGSITLKSSNPEEPPAIRPNYLAASADVDAMVTGVRFARKMIGTAPFASYRGDEVWPGEAAQSDNAIGNFVRERCETLYHPVGTCRMGNDSGAVLDDELRVHGLTGLRVADTSIMPTIIGGHTNASAIMIAERAAALIAA